jgi:putative (di)nucleoside polyphosphate hydrolase
LLDRLAEHAGLKEGATVVVDRGMAYDESIAAQKAQAALCGRTPADRRGRNLSERLLKTALSTDALGYAIKTHHEAVRRRGFARFFGLSSRQGKMSSKYLRYRRSVGIALFNAIGLVFLGRRFRDDGPEIILPGFEWQMPQGGIDPREDPYSAALRELFEETGVRNVQYLTETAGWLKYEFPPYYGPPHRLSGFGGQRQKWFALRFTGNELEIDTRGQRDTPPEFDIWRWERLHRVPDIVVPFKRTVYERVVEQFSIFSSVD